MDVSGNSDLILVRMYPGEEIVSSLVDACGRDNVSIAVLLIWKFYELLLVSFLPAVSLCRMIPATIRDRPKIVVR